MLSYVILKFLLSIKIHCNNSSKNGHFCEDSAIFLEKFNLFDLITTAVVQNIMANCISTWF